MNKAIFIDKDGTLIDNVPFNINPEFISLAKYVVEGLHLLSSANYLFIVISNQSGVALGFFKEADLQNVNNKIDELLAPENISIAAYYYCPHHPSAKIPEYAIDCACRKPSPGMLVQAAKDFDIDLSQSWMIGDILNDVEAGNIAGCHTILVNNGNETEWLLNAKRKPHFIVEHFKAAAEEILHHKIRQQTDFSYAKLE
jgi:D,D-heptose 1,7-bisphosphate phosphatase